MNEAVSDQTSRRDLIQRGLLLGGLAITGTTLLAGCQSAARGSSASLPGPQWPSESLPPRMPSPVPTQRTVTTPPSGPVRGVIPRSAWAKAGPKMSGSKPMNGVQRVTIHHDGTNASGLRGQSAVARRIESIREYHRSKGVEWIDIGYHYIIDPEGRVWEGRPISIEGAHVKATNEHNLGVMLLGNFDQHSPTGAQIATLNGFVRDQCMRYRVPTNRIYTHQELKQTACPGRNLQNYMQVARSGGGSLIIA